MQVHSGSAMSMAVEEIGAVQANREDLIAAGVVIKTEELWKSYEMGAARRHAPPAQIAAEFLRSLNSLWPNGFPTKKQFVDAEARAYYCCIAELTGGNRS